MLGFNVPTILLGGGGYNIKNVAKLWTYETALALGLEKDLDELIPLHFHSDFYSSEESIMIYNQPGV